MREKLRQFMYGRYGIDQFTIAIFGASLLIMLIASLSKLRFLDFFAFALLIYGYYRALSRNIYRRQQENSRFLSMSAPVRSFFRDLFTGFKDKNHRIYRCPSCKQKIRVPKGKGRIEIRCPKCRNTFIKRT